VSISPGNILEFVRVRLRFEKSSPKWRIVEEIEEDSTEIGSKRGARTAYAAGQDSARSIARSTGGQGRSTSWSTDMHDVHINGAVDCTVDRG